jgi:putative copper export protein
MIPVTETTIRLFLHVTAAAVWVGGQITLSLLVPLLRTTAPEALVPVARRFQQVAWPAFAVLIITGVWNLLAVDPVYEGAYLGTLAAKLALVSLSGLSAAAHSLVAGPAVRRATDDRERGRARALSGITGAGGLLFGLGAVFLGVQL